MSFEAAEQALFDLLFSRSLREIFARDPRTALAAYDLDEDEHEDFATIRPDALALDAGMRSAMVLSQLCVGFPVTFALASASGDLGLLSEFVDPLLMREAPHERPAKFGQRLRRTLALDAAELPQGHERVAVLDAELGMALTAASLLEHGDHTDGAAVPEAALPADWQNRPLRIGSYVSASLVPGSYAELKAALCDVADRLLYRHLVAAPLAPERVQRALEHTEPRVFIARARIDRASPSDATARHDTFELAEGFGVMLQHVDGANSASTLLDHLARAGATDDIVDGVAAGFQQLLERRFLTYA